MNSTHCNAGSCLPDRHFARSSGGIEHHEVLKRVMVSVLGMAAAISLTCCTTTNPGPPVLLPVLDAAPAPAYGPSGALAPAAPAAVFWPLLFKLGDVTYTIFEPKSDSWDGFHLMARSAVGVQRIGQRQPVFGVLSFTAVTLVDKSVRAATLAEVQIGSLDFPSAPAQTQEYLAVLLQEFPRRAPPVSLDRLAASLAPPRPPPAAASLNNSPPRIIIATRPSLLVYVDGPPVWQPVPGVALERVINTRLLLLKDPSDRCYLHLYDGYLQAPSLAGPWTVASQSPAGAEAAENPALDAEQADLLQGEPDPATRRLPSLCTSLAPDVFVVTGPTELLAFSGPPRFAPIPGTDLLYAENTSGNVFELLASQQSYLLIAGRWYCAPSLEGPWQFVPGAQLPPDFANIPDTSPKENVKAAVPGTRQAEELLIANSIPQSAALPRTLPIQDPRMDGPVRLAPIQGTPLNYVVNSDTPIIQVDPQSWYACQRGVWFASTSPNGPWTVTAFVPPVIYTIPATSPLHFVTYVRVYGSTPSLVYFGYTPGYLGTVVAGDGTVVYGTGYDYPPWIGDDWYGPPMTWGWGFDGCWTPWWGWEFDSGFGWDCDFGGIGWCCFYPPRPWWGGFRDRHDHDGDAWRNHPRGDLGGTGADLYHNHGRTAGNDLEPPGRRAGQGEQSGYGHAYNSRTGQLAAGQPPEPENTFGGLNRISQNDSSVAARGGSSINAAPRSGGWLRSIGNLLFHGASSGSGGGGSGGASHDKGGGGGHDSGGHDSGSGGGGVGHEGGGGGSGGGHR